MEETQLRKRNRTIRKNTKQRTNVLFVKNTAKHHPLWWFSFGQRTNREKGNICGGALPCPRREREKCRENDIHYSFSKTDRIKMRIGKNREKFREMVFITALVKLFALSLQIRMNKS